MNEIFMQAPNTMRLKATESRHDVDMLTISQ